MGRHSMVPYELIQQRIRYAVELKLSGLPISKILKQINKKAPETGWGEIKSRQLKRDIASHYAENDVVGEDEINFIRGSIELQREETEQIIEDLNKYVRNKNDWKPGEYERALRSVAELRMQYVEFFFVNKIKTNKIDMTKTPKINPEKLEFHSMEAGKQLQKEWETYPELREKFIFFSELMSKYVEGEISEEDFLSKLDAEHGFPSENDDTTTGHFIKTRIVGKLLIERRKNLKKPNENIPPSPIAT